MQLVPVAQPQRVPIASGFDYVTIDAQRRRVYAAHTGSRMLLVVDADTGNVTGQLRVGPMHGVAVDPATGTVFTGDGDSLSVSEVDPASMRVLASVDVAGPVDAIAYDAVLGRIYADEDDGTRIFVIDAKTMKQIATIALPGHKPEYLAVDPQTHDVYQNISDQNEYVVIDPHTLKVRTVVKTPGVTDNHPLQYDAAFGQIVTEGGGMLAVYDRAGTQRYQIAVPKGIDQCDLDQARHRLACAGGGKLTVVALAQEAAPQIVAELDVPRGVHTVGIDQKTGNAWIVWAAPDGDFVQRYELRP